MALKRQYEMTSVFSMASMTDIIFLLLIFFMVTSTYMFPTALEVNLPESSEQTALKPSTRIYVDSIGIAYLTTPTLTEPAPMSNEQLAEVLSAPTALVDTTGQAEPFVAVYADRAVTYGRLVEILDLGAHLSLKMVLATKPAPTSATPAVQ